MADAGDPLTIGHTRPASAGTDVYRNGGTRAERSDTRLPRDEISANRRYARRHPGLPTTGTRQVYHTFTVTHTHVCTYAAYTYIYIMYNVYSKPTYTVTAIPTKTSGDQVYQYAK